MNCSRNQNNKNPKNAYEIGNNQNFQKQQIAFLYILMTTPHTKNEAYTTKTMACRAVTDRHTQKSKNRGPLF